MERVKGGRVRLGSGPATWVAIAALAFAATASNAVAQERVNERSFDLMGTVTDETGQPLVGAFVSENGSKWGSLTDANGRFRIPDVTTGTLFLKAELIGYETLEWEGPVRADAAVALSLKGQPIILEGLTVVGNRFESRRRGTATSVRWFDHASLATAPQTTALDFMWARAGLVRQWCNGRFSTTCVLVRGRAVEPSVWIDEARVIGGVEYLASIPPHELYMLEVFAGGRQIRAYTPSYMERAAKGRLSPIAFVF